MSASNSGGGQDSEEEPRPPLFTRLASRGRRGVAAVGDAATNALSATKDGLDSMRDGAHKVAIHMDKWAADGVVSYRPSACAGTTALRSAPIVPSAPRCWCRWGAPFDSRSVQPNLPRSCGRGSSPF